MSDLENSKTSTTSKIDKKLLENPFVGSLIVPIAIVLVGALIVFGVTKMISTEHSYKDLVTEMKSKAFGNKWVAALELSKVISSKKIPAEDYPWLIDNLDEIFTTTIDPRTRNFVIVAAGALQDERALKIFKKGLVDKDDNVRFHTIVALANLPKTIVFDWAPVVEMLDLKDDVFLQATIFALGTHTVYPAEAKIEALMENSMNSLVRFAAATALVSFENEKSLEVIGEIFSLDEKSLEGKITVEDIRSLKFNVLGAIERASWGLCIELVEKVSQSDKDLKVIARAKEVLNLLKK